MRGETRICSHSDQPICKANCWVGRGYPRRYVGHQGQFTFSESITLRVKVLDPEATLPVTVNE